MRPLASDKPVRYCNVGKQWFVIAEGCPEDINCVERFLFFPSRDEKWMSSVKDFSFFKCHFQIRGLGQSLDTPCLW